MTQPLPRIPRPSRRRRYALIAGSAVVLLVLAGSLAGNVFLYRQFVSSYHDVNQIRLDPYGLKFRFYDPPASTNSEPLVVFFGDSRAEQWPAPENPQFRFLNRGIGGQTTAQILGRFDSHVAPLHPRVVILEAGINDLKTLALFPDRGDQIVSDCKANLRTIVRRTSDGGAVVIVATIFPSGPVPLYRKPQWSPEIDKAIDEVNADLRSLRSARVLVLDGHAILQRDGKTPPEYALDTLHINSLGYAKLNGPLSELMNSLPNQQGP